MSKDYRDSTGQIGNIITSSKMRLHSQRPGRKNSDGTIQYTTEQSHKDIVNINKIIRKYDKNGVISHIQNIEAQFGNLNGDDFKVMTDKIIDARKKFDKLPSQLRNRFRNNPAELLQFMDDPDNRKEAIDLGLIRGDWTPSTDGLGEHVQLGDNIQETVPPQPVQPANPQPAGQTQPNIPNIP